MTVGLPGPMNLACFYVTENSIVQVFKPKSQQSASVQWIKAVPSQCPFLLEFSDTSFVFSGSYSHFKQKKQITVIHIQWLLDRFATAKFNN